jgi:hypothetical protein
MSMATKAERYRAEAQVENSARKPKVRPAKTRSKTPDKPHNLSARAGRKAAVSYEPSNGRPSRKSTRGSAHHLRAASPLERRAQAKQAAPETRARTSRAKSVKIRGKG